MGSDPIRATVDSEETDEARALIICSDAVMETVRACVGRNLPWMLLVILSAGCVSHRSFADLSADVEAVPVPSGVTFVRQNQSIQNGPEFSDATYEQVVRQYSTSLPCGLLEDTWVQALQAAGRHYRIANYPHKFGSIGSLEIELEDRPEAVVITLGTDDGNCGSPFVFSLNSPH